MSLEGDSPKTVDLHDIASLLERVRATATWIASPYNRTRVAGDRFSQLRAQRDSTE